MSLIYKITNPNNQVYIGSTTRNLSLRKSEHKYRFNTKTKSKLYDSFLEYGFKNHSFEEMIFVNDVDRLELEHFIIQSFDTKLNEVQKYNNTAQGKIWVNNDIIEFQIYKQDFDNYQGIVKGRLPNDKLGRTKKF